MILLLTLWTTFVITAFSQCPPGLIPLTSNNNFNQPLTCTPQDPCSCFSVSARYGAICHYSSNYNNYLCCHSQNTQCGTNSSPQVSASGQVVTCFTNSQCASGYICSNGACCPNTNSNTCSTTGTPCFTGQISVGGQCFNSVNIGDRCQRSEQCLGGSQCQNNLCQCPNGFANVNQKCACQLGTVLFNSQCITLASPGQNCQISSQCIDNSVCNNQMCSCNGNYRLVFGYCVPFTNSKCQQTQTLVNNQCVLLSIVGETCIANQQCVGGAMCNSGTCRCTNGATAMYGYCISSQSTVNPCNSNQVYYNGQCYNTVNIGFQCQITQQCLGNSQCQNSFCQCTSGSPNNGICPTSPNTSNLCSSGQTVQLDNNNQPINCLVTVCPNNSFCQYSSSGQRYVCCRSTSGKKK